MRAVSGLLPGQVPSVSRHRYGACEVQEIGGEREHGSTIDDPEQEPGDATARVLAHEGIAAVSARRIGTQADANPALIYYDFGSLDELLAMLVQLMAASRTSRTAALRPRCAGCRR